MDGVDDENWLLAIDVGRALVVDAARRLFSAGDGIDELFAGLLSLRTAVGALDKLEHLPRP